MKLKPRRPLNDDKPNGLKENAKDYILNNWELCLAYLNKLEKNDRPRIEYIDIIYHHYDDHADGDVILYGIMAEAQVSYPTNRPGSRRLEHMTSVGIWGIEVDSSEAYIKEFEQDELTELKKHLENYEVNTDGPNWTKTEGEEKQTSGLDIIYRRRIYNRRQGS